MHARQEYCKVLRAHNVLLPFLVSFRISIRALARYLAHVPAEGVPTWCGDSDIKQIGVFILEVFGREESYHMRYGHLDQNDVDIRGTVSGHFFSTTTTPLGVGVFDVEIHRPCGALHRELPYLPRAHQFFPSFAWVPSLHQMMIPKIVGKTRANV